MDAMVSTQAILANRDMKKQIVTTRFDPRASKLSAVEFIVKFDELMTTYNEQQMHEDLKINDLQKKTHMQDALSNVATLKQVHHRELERAAIEGHHVFFTYQSYLMIVKGVAATYDEATAGRRGASINMMQFDGGDEDGTQGSDLMEEIQEYAANVIRRRMGGAAMNKETWESISPEGQKTWDLMSDKDKQRILRYAMKRAEKAERADKEKLSANNVDIEQSDEEVEEEQGEETDGEELDVNNANTDAKKKAHPGDPRRMMSGKGKGGSKKKPTKATDPKTAEITHIMFMDEFPTSESIEDVLVDYWEKDEDSDSDFQLGD
jgi:hypothetical protein